MPGPLAQLVENQVSEPVDDLRKHWPSFPVHVGGCEKPFRTNVEEIPPLSLQVTTVWRRTSELEEGIVACTRPRIHMPGPHHPAEIEIQVRESGNQRFDAVGDTRLA